MVIKLEEEGKKEKGKKEGQNGLIDVYSKYNISGRQLNQNEIDNIVEKYRKKKDNKEQEESQG